MQQKEELTERESLQIIQQMIDTAKQEQKDDGKGWIIWGWMLFLASVLTAINTSYNWFQTFFFWNMLGIITIVIFIVEIIKDLLGKKQQKVETYTKAIFKKLNIGFFICLFFIIIAMNVGIHPVKGFPLLMTLYGFWILIYGSLLDFKPSVIGAFVTWTLAFVALFQSNFQVIMLLHAAAALCGYIIPGHIANRKFKEITARKSFNQDSSV
jgi:hypothetical protein